MVRLWPSFAHQVSLSDAEIDSLWAHYDTDGTGSLNHGQVCLLIEEVCDAYWVYFNTYTSDELEYKYGMDTSVQEVVRTKLEFLKEEGQIPHLANALLVGT